MKPALAFPFNDPDGTMFHHMQAILLDLKTHFEQAYLCPPFSTRQHIEHLQQLQTDRLFKIFPIDREREIGKHFHFLYQHAAEAAPPAQIIHLCYLDRLAFALESEYRQAFLADMDSLTASDVPIIFQRSEFAWATHPQNYRELEGIVTILGNNLFDRQLDFAWCHIAATAGQLRKIMPFVKNPDLSMVAEMIFYLREEIKTREVD